MKEPKECRLFIKGNLITTFQAFSKSDVNEFINKQRKLQPPTKHHLMCFEVPSFKNNGKKSRNHDTIT